MARVRKDNDQRYLLKADGPFAKLDSNGQLDSSVLPPLAITETFIVANTAERLALAAQKGDIAIQTDNGLTYILYGPDPSVDGDWVELSSVETDPVFTASPAFNITSSQINNWDTAHSWGNHATAGYLTSFTETDPTVPPHVKSISTTDISNWDEAYGWGDHASGGYQPAGDYIARNAGELTSPDSRTTDFRRVAPNANNPTNTYYAMATFGNGSNVVGQSAVHFQDGTSYTRAYNASWSPWRRNWSDADFTATNVNNWDTAYGWGNHASQGYLVATTTDKSNWNTAYGWGNHASAGYAYASSIGGGSPYVDLATGNFGTIKVDDDRGVTWAGYAIRDDWVFMANGPQNAGIYNDTDNQWAIQWVRGGGTTVQGNFTATGTLSASGYNKSNWDTAYGWGNHASAGYLTSFSESDPTVPSHVKSISTSEKANWNTAYGWGNHASAGYLTSSFNSSLNSDSRNSRGVTRLYRRDSDSDYSLQTYWTGTRWRLDGYVGDNYHAHCEVGYASNSGTSASCSGNAATATWADTVDVNSSDTGGGNYSLVWHSNDTLYRSSQMYYNRDAQRLTVPNITATLTGSSTSCTGNSATATWANTVDVHSGQTGQSAWYDVVWHSGDTVYSTPNVEIYPGGGYLRATYLNMTHASTTRNSDTIFFSSNDSYIRKNDASGFRSSLNVPTRTGGNASGTWGISITGNAASATTAASCSGNSATATTATNVTGISRNVGGYGSIAANTKRNGYYGLSCNGHLVLMSDGGSAHGIYDDVQDEWWVRFYENAGVHLNFNNVKKLETSAAGVSITGSMTASGEVTAFSDARLKSNVQTLDGSKVYQMRGVSYEKDGAASSGVIAQELQEVAPELVHEGEEYLSVAYGNLVGYLIEAVKDLKAEVEELKRGNTDKQTSESVDSSG